MFNPMWEHWCHCTLQLLLPRSCKPFWVSGFQKKLFQANTCAPDICDLHVQNYPSEWVKWLCAQVHGCTGEHNWLGTRATATGSAAALIWAVSWCGCEMLWGEKWQSVPGVNEPICVPWKNWVHREWNCNLKKFTTVRASIKIPFRLIKWLSTLTNDKDLTVLGVVAYWWISLQPESPFQGCCLQLPLDAFPNCCLCPAHWQPNRIPYSSWK